MRTKYYNHAQEEGSVMIIGGMGLIIAIMIMASVSYTHLDVYKRQKVDGADSKIEYPIIETEVL